MADQTSSIVDQVSADTPWEIVETFSTMPRWKPEDVSVAADVIADALKKEGVPVTVHEPDLHLSIPFTASVTAEGTTYKAKPPAYAKSCPEGLEGELVYVPAVYSKSVGTLFDKNQDQDAARPERIAGKIVISEGFSFPHKIMEFEAAGAIGVIAVNPGANAHWGICTSIWGTPDLDDLPRKPNLPVVAVNNPDGNALIELAKRAGRVTLHTELDQGWYPSKIPVVEIPGTEEPEKFVLVHGHYDSWDVGVGDNATGDATLFELARVLWNNRDKLRRSVRIAWWSGHSTGRYAGSTWFADEFAIDLDENCVAQINCDSPGCRWATIYKDISWGTETEDFVKSVIMETTGLSSEGERPHRAGDYAFNNIGISSFFMLSSTMPDALREEKGYYAVGGCGGNIAWHTEDDTMEIADKEIFERDIKVYLASVLGVANADVLPFDWRATMREFMDTINTYQQGAGDLFDLSASREAVEQLQSELEEFYGNIGSSVSVDAANDVIAGLARILVPINFTREARFRHDPALPVPPLPTLSEAADLADMPDDMIGFAKTQLTRGQNRFVAAMRAASRLVSSAQ